MPLIQVKVLFIEVSNEDEEFLKQQYNQVSMNSPDYSGVSDTYCITLENGLDNVWLSM